MSSKVRSIKPNEIATNGNGSNPEAEALKVLTEARQKREKQCLEEINAILEKHKCEMRTVFVIGNQQIPVAQWINIPHQITIASK